MKIKLKPPFPLFCHAHVQELVSFAFVSEPPVRTADHWFKLRLKDTRTVWAVWLWLESVALMGRCSVLQAQHKSDVVNLASSTGDAGPVPWKAVNRSGTTPHNVPIGLCCLQNTAVQAKYSSSSSCCLSVMCYSDCMSINAVALIWINGSAVAPEAPTQSKQRWPLPCCHEK